MQYNGVLWQSLGQWIDVDELNQVGKPAGVIIKQLAVQDSVKSGSSQFDSDEVHQPVQIVNTAVQQQLECHYGAEVPSCHLHA